MKAVLLLPLLGAALALGLAAVTWWHENGPVRPADPPVPGRVSLGSHYLVGQEDSRAPAVARTRPMETAPAGSSFIAIVGGYVGNFVGPHDTFDNDWQRLGEPVVYEGWEGRFDLHAFLVSDGRGGRGHRVEVTKTHTPAGELTMPVVEVRNARLADVAQVYAARGDRLTSGTVRTSGPAVLVAFWWGDGPDRQHRAIPGDGFRVIDDFTSLPLMSGVQCAVAAREVDAAGEYSITWATTPAQGAALWLFAFEPATR